MNDRQRNDIVLVLGVLLVLAGVAALANNLGVVPPPVTQAWDVVWRLRGPLALVLLGVIVLLYATGSAGKPVMPAKEARLYRSRSDRWIAGVCGGIARWLRVDPLLVRAAWALLTLAVNPGAGIVAYFVLAFVMPEEPAGGASDA